LVAGSKKKGVSFLAVSIVGRELRFCEFGGIIGCGSIVDFCYWRGKCGESQWCEEEAEVRFW